MNRTTLCSILLAAAMALGGAAAVGACGSDNGTDIGNGGDGGGNGDGSSDDGNGGGFGNPDASGSSEGGNTSAVCKDLKSIAVTPGMTTQTVSPGTPFTLTYKATATYTNGTTADSTSSAFFSVDDILVGGFAGSVFTWNGLEGGIVTVSAKSCGVIGTATLTLKLAVTLSGDNDGGAGDAGAFTGGTPSGVTACNPTLVYPPDGVLLPPNMNVVEVHWKDGTPTNDLFEVSFENSATSVNVITSCTGSTAAQGMRLNGGCIFELNQAEWDFVANSNRGGDPVKVTVRAVGCDGTNVATSNSRNISFAQDDMRGALYYWASMRITVNAQNFNSGGVYRYDFGVRGQTADPILTPNSSVNTAENNCIGCHTVSRDGRQMVFDFDDNDSDDEYGDVFTDVYDIAANTVIKPIVKNGANNFPAGYHTWDRTTSQFLLSDGPGDGKDTPAIDAGAFRRITPAGAYLGSTKPGVRGTTPDWSPDDNTVVYAVPPYPTKAIQNGPDAGYWMAKAGAADDLMFSGASIYTAPWDAVNKSLGAPTLLIASDAANMKNYYYPSYSPDGSLIVFNYASDGSNFHNPKARVQIVKAGQATPTPDDLGQLNDVGTLTNSWARWSPFVQNYKGKKLLWLTMSSTRNYGLRIDNAGTVNCYPKESPNWVLPDFTTPPVGGCSRTQLWMAAIDLDTGAVQAGTDVSHPAFYLPFQDITTNNHLAQWAQKSFQGTCNVNNDCAAQPGKCCDNGGCTACPSAPTPPPATCSANVNCALGQCCNSGQCGACGTGSDGGPNGGPPQCQTCLDCNGQACNAGGCGSCSGSSDCCAPLVCANGMCVTAIK